MSSENVVFVSGAGLPEWIWDEVRADLGGDFLTMVARRDPAPDATVADHAAAALEAAPDKRLLVVAHSVGGVIAQEMVRRAPDRIAGVLGLSAAFPRVGRSFAGAMPFPQRVVLPVLLRLAGTRPPGSAIRSGLAAGLPAGTADRIVAEYATESRALFTDRVRDWNPPAGHHRVAFGYLSTASDRELPAAQQQASAASVDAGWRQELTTGHLPMLEDPAGVVRAVRAYATEIAR